MSADPAGFTKVKFVLTDSVGSVYPGIEALILWDSFDPDTLDTIASGVYSAAASHLMPMLNSRWTLSRARLLYSDGSVVTPVDHFGTTAGSLGTSSDGTRNDCVVSGYRIASYYRGGKPRTYWPGTWRLQSGSITAWNTALIGDMKTAVDTMLSDIAGIGGTGLTSITPGCIRRTGSGITTPTFFPYLDSHVDVRVCSQRRRVPR